MSQLVAYIESKSTFMSRSEGSTYPTQLLIMIITHPILYLEKVNVESCLLFFFFMLMAFIKQWPHYTVSPGAYATVFQYFVNNKSIKKKQERYVKGYNISPMKIQQQWLTP